MSLSNVLTVNFGGNRSGRITVEAPLNPVRYEHRQRQAGATAARELKLRCSGFPPGAAQTIMSLVPRPEVLELARPIGVGGAADGLFGQTLNLHTGRLFGGWQDLVPLSFNVFGADGRLIDTTDPFPVRLLESGAPAVAPPDRFLAAITKVVHLAQTDEGPAVYVYYDVQAVPTGTQMLALAFRTAAGDRPESETVLGGRGRYFFPGTLPLPQPADGSNVGIEAVLRARRFGGEVLGEVRENFSLNQVVLR